MSSSSFVQMENRAEQMVASRENNGQINILVINLTGNNMNIENNTLSQTKNVSFQVSDFGAMIINGTASTVNVYLSLKSKQTNSELTINYMGSFNLKTGSYYNAPQFPLTNFYTSSFQDENTHTIDMSFPTPLVIPPGQIVQFTFIMNNQSQNTEDLNSVNMTASLSPFTNASIDTIGSKPVVAGSKPVVAGSKPVVQKGPTKPTFPLTPTDKSMKNSMSKSLKGKTTSTSLAIEKASASAQTSPSKTDSKTMYWIVCVLFVVAILILIYFVYRRKHTS